MSKDDAIRYVELKASPEEVGYQDPVSFSEPVMPSACQAGGCGGGSPPQQQEIDISGPVRVNKIEISPDQIAREMQNHRAEDAQSAWVSAARALAIRELLLQEAARLGISGRPESDSVERVETETDADIRALLEDQLAAAEVPEEACQRYYDQNTHRFRTPDLFEAAHILIEPAEDSEDGWQAAKMQAQQLIGEVGHDQSQFAEAAKKHSGCPTGQQGGVLGQVRRGELTQSLQDVLEQLREGCTASHPVRSRYGWHVVRLLHKIPGQTLPFELAQEKITDMLEARAWVNSASDYIVALARKGRVEGIQIDPAATE
ncbi:peptidylprolyl isomerase [Biformimicrobium ophioploci]|uniref:peptidylprolyl isomerase n=1 Tax=Biformimicrobium ophioploci TaxID=3036711 RepID=A0ABQ6M1W4_9GAMM|nr:peptidylprolyl isomerase [Microbulbifer sp. NKW57]GMG88349.1 peptidylprolyl isomerase [Microbulbifer sp. NKW57]